MVWSLLKISFAFSAKSLKSKSWSSNFTDILSTQKWSSHGHTNCNDYKPHNLPTNISLKIATNPLAQLWYCSYSKKSTAKKIGSTNTEKQHLDV
jgi:hypothetical protein